MKFVSHAERVCYPAEAFELIVWPEVEKLKGRRIAQRSGTILQLAQMMPKAFAKGKTLNWESAR